MKAKNFGRNLKRVLDTLGMNQVELANKTGLTTAAVSQIINHKRDPSLSTVIKILQAVPVKFEALCR